MYEPTYYRDQAERARRLSAGVTDRGIAELLNRVARDYRELAEDLEVGAVEIRHREMMPQSHHAEHEVEELSGGSGCD